jgi:hypothetical protein
MATLAILSALALAQSGPTIVAQAPPSDAVAVGYVALNAGKPADAIAVITAHRELANDPAALINLGTAHARMGQADRAGRYYIAAIASSDRYDLQLADGSWMDSRQAARVALSRLGHGPLLAVR